MSLPSFKVDQIPSLAGKVAIVTGASAGIGLESALQLATKGCHVICVVRNKEKGEAAVADIKAKSGNDKVEVEIADLADLKTVKAFAERFIARGLPLHILMNNAGVSALKFGLTTDGYENQWQSNHLAHFYLTLLLLPVLVKTSSPSSPVTITNVSSESAWMSYNGEGGVLSEEDQVNESKYSAMKAYGQSKLGQVGFTRELAKKLGENANIVVTALHPGTMIRTEITSKVDAFWGASYAAQAISWLIGPTVPMGALTQLYVATFPLFPDLVKANPIVSGTFYEYICKVKNVKPTSWPASDELAKRVWELSERQVKKAGFEVPEVPKVGAKL